MPGASAVLQRARRFGYDTPASQHGWSTQGEVTMSKMLIGCAILALAAILVVGLMVGGIYNRLVGLNEGVDSAWAQVENVYQRRADLIPNLVATVKGAAEFEQETLQNVIEARAKVGQVNFDTAPTPEQMQQFQANQDGLSSALSRLLVVVEQYPELKATQAFRDLQVQLEGTENRITVERQRYNEVAREYNTSRNRVPAVLVANLLGFPEKAYFESKPGAEEPPKVEF
jgi:LemA protein